MTVDRLATLLAAAPGDTPAAKLHAVAMQLRETSTYMRLLLCEVSAEIVRTRAYREQGYDGAWRYLRVIWAGAYKRTSLHWIVQLGTFLHSVPDGHREWLRSELASCGGLGRALAITPILPTLEDARQAVPWLRRAQDAKVSSTALRAMVANALKGESSARKAAGIHGNAQPVCPTCRRPLPQLAGPAPEARE